LIQRKQIYSHKFISFVDNNISFSMKSHTPVIFTSISYNLYCNVRYHLWIRQRSAFSSIDDSGQVSFRHHFKDSNLRKRTYLQNCEDSKLQKIQIFIWFIFKFIEYCSISRLNSSIALSKNLFCKKKRSENKAKSDKCLIRIIFVKTIYFRVLDL